MNAKLIIQARIEELDTELMETIKLMESEKTPGGASMLSMKQKFERVEGYKDKVLALRAGIAELKKVKELV